ncbi:MAG TPA: helix-turn-helix domain-containing protein [Blastocatellia bacterium]|nr:helix-turn-helix domain-containing protein [Blastocatellia bacterium]
MEAKPKTMEITAERIAEECVAVRLRVLTRAVTSIYNRALRPHRLTVSQMNILVAISCLGEARQQAVCRALHLEKSSLSRDLARMLARGWVNTLAGEDGRTSLLTLTTTGRRLLNKAIPAWQRAQQQAIALMGDKQVAGLNRAVKTLRAAKAKNLI